MRANQPMGLSTAAHDLIRGLIQVSSDRFYEGYWDERFPLFDYVTPTPALAARLAARERLAAALAALDAEIETAGRELVARKEHAYSEYEQGVLYSSGPVIFLALRTPDGEPVAASLRSGCAMEASSEGRCYCEGDLCAPDCPEGCLSEGPE
jgi:hypothetical protein